MLQLNCWCLLHWPIYQIMLVVLALDHAWSCWSFWCYSLLCSLYRCTLFNMMVELMHMLEHAYCIDAHVWTCWLYWRLWLMMTVIYIYMFKHVIRIDAYIADACIWTCWSYWCTGLNILYWSTGAYVWTCRLYWDTCLNMLDILRYWSTCRLYWHICLNMQFKVIHMFEPASYIDAHACVVLSMQISMLEYLGPINVHVWKCWLSWFMLTLLFKNFACTDAQV